MQSILITIALFIGWVLMFWFCGGIYIRLGHIRQLLAGIFALLKKEREP